MQKSSEAPVCYSAFLSIIIIYSLGGYHAMGTQTAGLHWPNSGYIFAHAKEKQIILDIRL